MGLRVSVEVGSGLSRSFTPPMLLGRKLRWFRRRAHRAHRIWYTELQCGCPLGRSHHMVPSRVCKLPFLNLPAHKFRIHGTGTKGKAFVNVTKVLLFSLRCAMITKVSLTHSPSVMGNQKGDS